MASYLYIHIPFCRRKCIYCDFNSIPLDKESSGKIMDDYINALCIELTLIAHLSEGLSGIYVGGGTPTLLDTSHLLKLMSVVRNNFNIEFGSEVTIEANPGAISKEKADVLKNIGFNRISIGIQSLNNSELEILGRVHNAGDAVAAVSNARNAGFNNISVDMIYGIASLKSKILKSDLQIKNWEHNLSQAMELEPQHISAYELTPEKSTPLYDALKAGRLIMPDEDAIAEMYYRGIDMLESNGYSHYEISNFAKYGFECRHNSNYWNRGQYIGAGAGAHSFIGNVRYCNIANITKYIDKLKSHNMPLDKEDTTTDMEAYKEIIFLGLRKTGGIELNSLPEHLSFAIKKAAEDKSISSLLSYNNNSICLTRKGLILSNEVISRLLLCIENCRRV
jgi:oxygen-independent coproporphyrinogen-3 oxidase